VPTGCAFEVVVTEASTASRSTTAAKGMASLCRKSGSIPIRFELDAVGRGDADASHLLRRARDVVGRALEAVEELGALGGMLGLSSRSTENLTSAAVNGRHLLKTTSWRRRKLRCRPSGLASTSRRARVRCSSLVVLDQRVEEHLL